MQDGGDVEIGTEHGFGNDVQVLGYSSIAERLADAAIEQRANCKVVERVGLSERDLAENLEDRNWRMIYDLNSCVAIVYKLLTATRTTSASHMITLTRI